MFVSLKMRSKHRLQDLIHAIKSNDLETVEEMLTKNSGLLNRPRGIDGRFLLLSQVIHCKDKAVIELVVSYLSEFGKLARKRKLQKLLPIAVQKCNVRVTELLLKRGATLVDSQWLEVDATACRIFHNRNITDTRKEMLALLLDHGLVVGTRNSCNGSLLRQFIFHVDKDDRDVAEIAEMLINSGIPVNETDNYGMAPLQHSVFRRNVALVSALVERGANVNARDRDEETALHDACSVANAEAVGLLIRKGAELSPVSRDGETPFGLLFLEDDTYGACVEVMVKEFAKLSFEDLPVSLIDMELVRKNLSVRELFEKCTSELQKMANTKFYRAYTYHWVLKTSTSMKKLARLTRNEEFFTKFEANLQGFPYYEKDLRMIMDEAVRYKNKSTVVESKLNSVFNNYLPEVVIRILVDKVCSEDLPLE